MVGEMSLARLQQLLEAKKGKLDLLQKKRDVLRKQLTDVESKIEQIGGVRSESVTKKSAGIKGKGRKRPKNDRTLLEVCLELLGQNKKGLGLGEMAQKVLQSGYKTNSTKFENTVYQCLYNNTDKVAHDAVNHVYRIK